MTFPETKRSLRQLSHRLRSRALPAGELPAVPLLLQRLDLRDHDLFEDFCATAAAQWKGLSASEMAKLFRNTQDYHLLHSIKGTAMCRLVSSLEAAVDESHESHESPRALASLCHGSLAVRRPLPKLRLAFQRALDAEPGAAETVELLAAAGELHRAIGVGSPTLKALATRCGQALGGEEVSPGQLSLVARACGRLALVLPADSTRLFKALIAALRNREADIERVLPACRQLPSSLRRLLVESGLLKLVQPHPRQIETRLHLMHDLSLHAVARGGAPSLTEDVKVLLVALQEGHNGAAAAGYMAATTVAHSLALAGADGAEFRGFAEEMLSLLQWEDLTPHEVQVLFRTPGDVSEASSQAAKHAQRIKDPQALAALLQAAKALPSAELAAAVCPILAHRALETKEVSQLSLLEAATRKGPMVVEPQEQIDLRQRIRRSLFKSVHEAPAAFDRRPNRGFIRYVEKCMSKDRTPQEVLALPSPGHDFPTQHAS